MSSCIIITAGPVLKSTDISTGTQIRQGRGTEGRSQRPGGHSAQAQVMRVQAREAEGSQALRPLPDHRRVTLEQGVPPKVRGSTVVPSKAMERW